MKNTLASYDSGERTRLACWRSRPRDRELLTRAQVREQQQRPWGFGDGAKTCPRGRVRSPIQNLVLVLDKNLIAHETTSGYGPPTSNAQRQRGPPFDLEDRLLEFTVRLTKLVEALPTSRTGNHVAGQLLRCGTSPFANHGEVQPAESRKDFIHKLGICFKELNEVRRWLRFIARRELLPLKRITALLTKTEELIKIFSASIRTAEKNSK
jgi:four helix bundle protein